METKAVLEIKEVLGLSEGFKWIDLPYDSVVEIEPLLTPFLEDCQNDSPSVGELVVLCKKHKASLGGYITESDRADCRISFCSVSFISLSNEEMVELINTWHGVDDLTLSRETDGSFSLRLWWD